MESIWDEIIEKSRESSEKIEQNSLCGVMPGQLCPQCGLVELEYNGSLAITCPKCGFETGGSYT